MKHLLLLAFAAGVLSSALPAQAQSFGGTYGGGYPVDVTSDTDFGWATAGVGADGTTPYASSISGSSLSSSAALTALNTDNTLATVENSLNELENIDYLDLNELIQTTDIMNSLGWANDFFTQNSGLISQLQTLNPGLNLFNNPSGQGLDNGYSANLGTASTPTALLGNIAGLFMHQVGSLCNIQGGTSSDVLAGLNAMTQAQMQQHPIEAATAVALAWNTKVLSNAQSDATLIDDFEKSGQQLSSAAQSQTTLEGQMAINNQIALLKSRQQNTQLRDQSQMNAANAVQNSAILEILARDEFQKAADAATQ